VSVEGVPMSWTDAPTACASASGAVRVTPVPVAPLLPTVWMVRISWLGPESMRTR
jgi:hypothetical protein